MVTRAKKNPDCKPPLPSTRSLILPAAPPRSHAQMQRWDLEARTHRARLRRLDKFRFTILSDDPNRPGTAASNNNNSLLLDLSPEREGRAFRAVKGRRKAAAEAIKGARLALRDLEDWKGSVLAERAEVASFLRLVDPTRAFAAGASCDADAEGGAGCCGGGGTTASSFEAEVVVADPAFLAAEGVAEAGSEGGRPRRHASWAGTGAETASSDSSPTSSSTVGSRDGSIERGARGGSAGGGGGGRRSRAPGVGFLRALAALDPCVGALRGAKSSSKTGDRLGMALETLREHVRVTLIDLMDLETSIPGEALESDHEEGGGADAAALGGESPAGPILALTAADAGALDVKVAALVRRLSGGGSGSGDGSGGGSGSGRSSGEAGEASGGSREPPSLASVYENGLRGAAAASEAEVDTTESLTARAVRMLRRAVAGPMLWALDDAYQVREPTERNWRGGGSTSAETSSLLTRPS